MTQKLDVPTTLCPSPNPVALSSKRKPKKKKPQKIVNWFDGPQNYARGESSLWVAVITQAMMDALTKSTHPENLYHKHAAIQWLTGNSKDFTLVCLFAGFDPDYVRRKAKRALSSPVEWRAAPGKGARYHERRAYREKVKRRRRQTPVEQKSVLRTSTLDTPESHTKTGMVIIGPWR